MGNIGVRNVASTKSIVKRFSLVSWTHWMVLRWVRLFDPKFIFIFAPFGAPPRRLYGELWLHTGSGHCGENFMKQSLDQIALWTSILMWLHGKITLVELTSRKSGSWSHPIGLHWELWLHKAPTPVENFFWPWVWIKMHYEHLHWCGSMVK